MAATRQSRRSIWERPVRRARPVIHLLDSASGLCQVIVKVPINDGARAAILREADVLISLASEGCAFSPRLLFVDRNRGISTQTFLSGASGSRRLLPEYLRLLHALRLPGETIFDRRTRRSAARTAPVVRDF